MHPLDDDIKTRFVILALARSGSTALTATLKTHPDVYCFGSPLFRNPKGVALPWEQALPATVLAKRHTDPLEFIYDVLNHRPAYKSQASALGFKLWGNAHAHAADVISTLAGDTRVKKIILDRKNHLACFSSNGLVTLKQNRPWMFRLRPRLGFDADVFLKFHRRRTRRKNSYRQASKGDVLELPYEGLMEHGLTRVCSFLDLASFAFDAQTDKRNSGDILGRFKKRHHNAIRRTLDQLGHPEWIYEGDGLA